MSFNDARQEFALVRSYSYEVEQRIPETSPAQYTLAQALARDQSELEVLAEPWRALFGSTEFRTSVEYVVASAC